MSSISTAELAIYALFSIAVLYILVKHGRPGFLGWFYLFIFCTIRIVGGVLEIKKSSSASVVANIGLSPLLLATSGILHEGKTYCLPAANRKTEVILLIAFHMTALVGVALLAAGISGMQSTSPHSNSFTLVKSGISILTAAWGALVAWSIFTLALARQYKSKLVHPRASILLWSVLFALVFVGISIIYKVVALVSQDATLNPTTGSLGVRIALSFLPELIASIIFIISGLLTRDISQNNKHLDLERPQL